MDANDDWQSSDTDSKQMDKTVHSRSSRHNIHWSNVRIYRNIRDSNCGISYVRSHASPAIFAAWDSHAWVWYIPVIAHSLSSIGMNCPLSLTITIKGTPTIFTGARTASSMRIMFPCYLMTVKKVELYMSYSNLVLWRCSSLRALTSPPKPCLIT